MLVLEPICHETIWGGPRISKLTGVSGEKIGHLYSVFCRENISNRILNGKWKGKYLNDVFPVWKTEFQMKKYTYFPLTMALTEADEHLSIQVHPDDKTANKLENTARGKRESWYFLEPPSTGYIYNGCICQDETERDRFIQEKKYLDMTDQLEVKPGDYVFVEPGTLHSITAGSLVYEIEEGADFTYRFYDFDRIDAEGSQRELHIEKANAALCIYQKSVTKRYNGTNWIEEATYATRKIEKVSTYRNKSTTVECFTMIQGQATCDNVCLHSGMTALLWPQEVIGNAEIGLAFVSKLKEGI